MTSSRLLARNSAINLLGQVLPVVAAVIAIPPLMRGLGEDRFGVLTLAWAAIGYFSLFELGLSRALTHAVAQRLGHGDTDELPSITWSALLLLLLFGGLGGIVFAAVSPALVTRVLNLPPGMQRETLWSFWILAAALPLVLTTTGLRALMEAHQHFGIATLLRVPTVVFSFVGPLLLLPFTKSLVPAVAILAVGRVVSFAMHAWLAVRLYPFLGVRRIAQRASTLALLRYGGWSTVSNIVSPMMVYLDRFVIGAMLTAAAVAHYVTPYEVVVKLLIIPTSIVTVLLPAFSASLHAAVDRSRGAVLYDRTYRAVMIAIFPFVLTAVALAEEGLQLWVGAMLPPESAVVLRWLAVGVFASALAQAPHIAFLGAGRPDIIAKLHIAELPVYVVLLIVLAREFGLPGVAMAWTIRGALDALLLFILARSRLGLPLTPRVGGGGPMVLLAGAIAVAAFLESVQARVAWVFVTMLGFLPYCWFTMLTQQEREGLRDWLRTPGETKPLSIEELV